MIRLTRHYQYRLTTLELCGPVLDMEIRLLSKMSKTETRTIAREMLAQLRPWLRYFDHTGISQDRRGICRGLSKPIGPSRPTSQVGFDIRLKRLERGWSQTELAEKIKITRAHLSDLERGLYVPRARLKSELARVFGDCVGENNTE